MSEPPKLRSAFNTTCANCNQRNPFIGKPGRGADWCQKHSKPLANSNPFWPYNLEELSRLVCQWRLDNPNDEQEPTE